MNSVQIKSYIITGSICFVLGASVCGGLVYRHGANRIGQLGGELEAIRAANGQLAGQLAQREVVVNQLAESIDARQGTIDAAKRELEGSRSSIAKIRAVLEHLKTLELYRRSYGYREYYDTGIDPR